MAEKEKSGYLQASYALSAKVEDVRISVLAHKILFKWQTNKRTKDGYVVIKDDELANTIYVTVRTISKFVDKLEEINFLKTKRGRGVKYYKINTAVAKKYFKV